MWIMFGIKKNVYNIIALILSACGITLLALKLFGVFGEEKETNMIFTLSSVVLLLLAFALYLRPKSKMMQVTQSILSKYRTDVYTLIMQDSSKNKVDVRKVIVKEREDGHLMMQSLNGKKEIIFEDLSFAEGLYITIKLVEEFAMVMYAVVDEDKKLAKYKKPTVATIDQFELELTYLNGEVKQRKIIEDYKFL